MEQLEIIESVNATLTQNFEVPPEKLRGEATLFDELEFDSLDAIDMMVYLEEKFQVQVPGEIFKEVKTLGDVYRLVGDLTRATQSKGQA